MEKNVSVYIDHQDLTGSYEETRAILALGSQISSPTSNGVFEIYDSGISIAVIGTFTVKHSNSGNIVCSTQKNKYDDPNGVGSIGNRLALIGCNFEADHKPVVQFDGSIVLVKTSELIDFQKVALGEIDAAIGDETYWDYKFTLITGSTEIEVIRRCSVMMDNPSVNFGSLNSFTGFVGEVAKADSHFTFECSGNSQNMNNIANISIQPTHTVTGDTRAIGLQFNGSTSNSLVVRAFTQYSGNKSCNSGDAIQIDMPTKFSDLPATSFNHSFPLHWLLCKKNTESLPSGTFTGSATIIINID